MSVLVLLLLTLPASTRYLGLGMPEIERTIAGEAMPGSAFLFDAQGRERPALRRTGYLSAEELLGVMHSLQSH